MLFSMKIRIFLCKHKLGLRFFDKGHTSHGPEWYWVLICNFNWSVTLIKNINKWPTQGYGLKPVTQNPQDCAEVSHIKSYQKLTPLTILIISPSFVRNFLHGVVAHKSHSKSTEGSNIWIFNKIWAYLSFLNFPLSRGEGGFPMWF